MRAHGTVRAFRGGCRCAMCADTAKRNAERQRRNNDRRMERMHAQGLTWRGKPLQRTSGMDVSEAIDEIARVMHG